MMRWFIVEIAVHQQWQGRGIGRMMLTRVADTARAMGYPALTLTTFREVPWNAPFYTRLGFCMLDEQHLAVRAGGQKGAGNGPRPAAGDPLHHAPGAVAHIAAPALLFPP
nr:Histone acetyltransferase HPA2 [Raoultella sp. NCTC 9187]